MAINPWGGGNATQFGPTGYTAVPLEYITITFVRRQVTQPRHRVKKRLVIHLSRM
jgi:hypothetical protein